MPGQEDNPIDDYRFRITMPETPVIRCQICSETDVCAILDCGPQPLCNRFVTDPDAVEFRHPLELVQCRRCGLIQIARPVPDAEIVPHFDWLRYNEPEAHLDHLARTLCGLPNLSPRPVAAGLTYKDDTLLTRLEADRFERTWRIDPEADFGIRMPGVCSETVQAYLTFENTRRLVEKRGPVDVLVARHMYEHASDTHRLLDALKPMIKPDGYLVFEVPDCTRLLDTRDYSMPWEEHNLYFTPETFKQSFSFSDYRLICSENYPYPVENALVAVAALKGPDPYWMNRHQLEEELHRGAAYAGGFAEYCRAVCSYLKRYKDRVGGIAVFGAGHVSCTYINLMKIQPFIDFVVDDHPQKQGLFMPGSKVPIVGSRALTGENIRLCLLTLSPESEQRVKVKQRSFIDRGGEFASVFPSSPSALDLRLA